MNIITQNRLNYFNKNKIWVVLLLLLSFHCVLSYAQNVEINHSEDETYQIIAIADSLFDSNEEPEIALNYIDSIINSGHIEIIPLLERQIHYLWILENYSEALLKNRTLLDITSIEDGYNHPVFAVRKQQEAELYYKLDSLSLAIKSAEQALLIFESTEIFEEGREDNDPSILDCHLALSKYHRLNHNFEAALQHILYADSIGHRCYEPNDFMFSRIKFQEGMTYEALGQLESACNNFRESLDICEKNGIDGSLRFSRMFALADVLLKTGDYNRALKINKRISDEAEAYNDFNNLLLALGGQVEIYINQRSMSDILECIQIIEKIISENEINDANGFLTYYYTLAGDYFFNELHYQVAIDLYRKSRDLTEFSSEEYSIVCGKIANTHFRIGDIASAIKLTEEELNNRFNLYGEYSPLTANSLNNLGLFYEDLGQIDQAKYYAQRAFIIRDSILPDNHPQYIHSLSNMAELYLRNDSIGKSIELQYRLLSLQSQYEDTQKYSQDLANLGFTYLHTDSLFKAKECFKKALDISKHLFTKKSYQYARVLSYLSRYYEHRGLLNKAFKYEKESINIFKELYGEHNEQYLSRIDRIIWLGYLIDKWKIVNMNIQTYQNYLVDLTLNNLLKLDKSKRGDYWDVQKSWFLNDQLLYASDKRATRKMIENAYDGLLYGKSLLLRVENYVSKLVNDCTESHPLDNSTSAFKDLKWSDVRNNLTDKEIAIEFASFNNGDTIQYIALVIDPNKQSPEIVKLFTENELLSSNPSDYYTTNIISDLVWKPLAHLIAEKTNIYFSPYGLLHTIAIESLPYGSQNNIIGNIYNIFRLTSTRELIIKQEDGLMENAVLYGDIDYSLTNHEEIKCIERYSRDMRKGVAPLPATKKEISAIKTALVSKEIIPNIFVKQSATEESFKLLDGAKTNIMHIATHGFFWSDSMRLDNHKSKILDLYQKDAISNEELSLCNSGLLFAGANNSLSGNVLNSNDDGVLTAKEISNLDLMGLDLVVLSACETGLGNLNSDGVFGVQRGFKIAGAKSIIMSLWEVDDDATQLLMTEFYKNYLNGKSKRESLLAAQKVVRETHGFEDPEYWAAFILLDALN